MIPISVARQIIQLQNVINKLLIDESRRTLSRSPARIHSFILHSIRRAFPPNISNFSASASVGFSPAVGEDSKQTYRNLSASRITLLFILLLAASPLWYQVAFVHLFEVDRKVSIFFAPNSVRCIAARVEWGEKKVDEEEVQMRLLTQFHRCNYLFGRFLHLNRRLSTSSIATAQRESRHHSERFEEQTYYISKATAIAGTWKWSGKQHPAPVFVELLRREKRASWRNIARKSRLQLLIWFFHIFATPRIRSRPSQRNRKTKGRRSNNYDNVSNEFIEVLSAIARSRCWRWQLETTSHKVNYETHKQYQIAINNAERFIFHVRVHSLLSLLVLSLCVGRIRFSNLFISIRCYCYVLSVFIEPGAGGKEILRHANHKKCGRTSS